MSSRPRQSAPAFGGFGGAGGSAAGGTGGARARSRDRTAAGTGKPGNDHAPVEVFAWLARGEATAEEARTVVRHLLGGCAVCLARAEDARRIAAPASDRAYDLAFGRLGEAVACGIERRQDEREKTQELFAELLGLEPVEGLIQLQSTRRYASLALCELLLQQSRDLWAVDPGEAQKAARFAVEVAEQLDLELYGAPVIQDLRAISWAYLADVQRITSDLRSAESSLALAECLLEEGSGDPLVKAELLALRASLCGYCGRFDEAVRLLNRAASIYRRMQDLHLLGRTLIKKGTVLGNAGEAASAVRLLREGIDLIEPRREPRLMVSATHNLIWFLHESGDSRQAEDCRAAARRLYEAAGDRRELHRLRWLEGKLAAEFPAAEQALREARDGLAREGLSYEAALAAMDLAVLYAATLKAPDMRRQAAQMLTLFQSGDLYRETVVALSSFERQERGASDPSGLIRELGDYIRRAREEKNPSTLARDLSP